MTDFGKAPIKMEGGIADPDEFEWDCICEDCKVKYQKWKEAYDIQQKQLRGEAPAPYESSVGHMFGDKR
jgi:hypothetical protein